MDAKLVVVAGDTEATEVKLRLPAIIGRGREATLTVPHPLVSRQHCEIFEKDDYLVVRDLGSLNGTFIGDERVSEAVLRDGELLTVGTVTFRAVYCDDPNLSAPVRQEEVPDSPSVSTPAVADQPGQRPDRGSEDEGETERVQPPAAPVAEEPVAEEDDEEFEQFLHAMDVEAESVDAEVPEVEVEATLDYSAPPSQPEVEVEPEVYGVDDTDEVGENLESVVEEVEEVEQVEEVEEADEVEKVDEVEMAEPAEPAGAGKRAAATAALSSDSKNTKSGKQPSNEEDDELQSFFRELDI